ncbi:MAG: VWA domain-containing protein, partial [Chloroflexi bacterium]|nr:VWA domain-containing protein [Chloroflexota bacterium]
LWDWRCLGRVDDLSQGSSHTLNLWAGGAGFSVDRIVIQTRDDGSCSNDSSPPDSPDGYPANNGRTNWACLPCDPRFAGRPGGQTSPSYRPDCNIGGNPDQRGNPIYDDEQPIRNALEAAKYFVGLLDPRFDQVGYVRYSTYSEIANELECSRRLGVNCTEQVIIDTVVSELDATSAGGNTNIAGGIQDGIEVLSTDTDEGHYGRPGAAHIMVLMTDGEANQQPNNYCDDDPDLWPNDSEGAKDCVIYYAQEARDNGIVIYTISLGWGADIDLMTEVAEITGGDWFVARPATRDKLDEIFEELFEKIFLRLIS